MEPYQLAVVDSSDVLSLMSMEVKKNNRFCAMCSRHLCNRGLGFRASVVRREEVVGCGLRLRGHPIRSEFVVTVM